MTETQVLTLEQQLQRRGSLLANASNEVMECEPSESSRASNRESHFHNKSMSRDFQKDREQLLEMSHQ